MVVVKYIFSPSMQAVGKYYAIGTSHGLALVFGMYIILLKC